jgi:hypothetical protein
MTKNITTIIHKFNSSQDKVNKLKKKDNLKRSDGRWMKINGINQSVKRINNNGHITKSKILLYKRQGDLKLGFFSDTGFRNFEINSY